MVVDVGHAGSALLDPETIFKHLPITAGARVADFGCGRTGHFIFYIARKAGDTGIVYAVDIMKDILDSIASRVRSEGYDTVQTVWSNVELLGATPIPEDSLDLVCMVGMLSQVQDKAGMLSEARRLLKTGGKVLVIDWAKRLGPLGPAPEKLLSAIATRELARMAGYQTLDEFVAGEYHFGVILEKLPA